MRIGPPFALDLHSSEIRLAGTANKSPQLIQSLQSQNAAPRNAARASGAAGGDPVVVAMITGIGSEFAKTDSSLWPLDVYLENRLQSELNFEI